MEELFQAGGQIHIDASAIPKEIVSAAKEAQKTANRNPVKIAISADSAMMTKQIKKDQATLLKELQKAYDEYSFNKLDDNGFAKAIQVYIASGGKINDTFKSITLSYNDLKDTLKDGFIPLDQIELFSDTLARVQKVSEGIDFSGVDFSKLEKLNNALKKVYTDGYLTAEISDEEFVAYVKDFEKQGGIFTADLKEIKETYEGYVDEMSNMQIPELSLLKYADPSTNLKEFFDIIRNYASENGLNKLDNFFLDLEKRIANGDDAAKHMLKTLGLLKGEVADAIKAGNVHYGGLVGDETVAITRRDDGHRYEETLRLKDALEQAAEEGIQVARILDIIKDEQSELFLEIQQAAPGDMLAQTFSPFGEDFDFVNLDALEASEEQIEKFIKDLIRLNELAIGVDFNTTNFMFDKEKGFSFIDLDLNPEKFKNNEEIVEKAKRLLSDIREYYSEVGDTSQLAKLDALEQKFHQIGYATAQAVAKGYADGQDSHSPSKEAKQLVDDFADGIKQGADKNENNAHDAGQQMANDFINGYEDKISELERKLSDTKIELEYYKTQNADMVDTKSYEEQVKRVGELQSEVEYLNQEIRSQQSLLDYSISSDTYFALEDRFIKVTEEAERLENELNTLQSIIDSLKATSPSQTEVLSGTNTDKLEQDLNDIYRLMDKIDSEEIFSEDFVSPYTEKDLQRLVELLREICKLTGNGIDPYDITEGYGSKYFKSSYYDDMMDGAKPETDEGYERLSIIRDEQQVAMMRTFGANDIRDAYFSLIDSIAPTIQAKLEEMFTLDPNALRQHFEDYGGIIQKTIGSDAYYDWDEKLFPTVPASNQTPLSSDETKEAEKIVEVNKELEESYEKVTQAKRKVASKDNTPKLAVKSAEESVPAITEEAVAAEKIADNMSEAASAKESFAKANQKVENSAEESASALSEEANKVQEVTNAVNENTKAQEKNSKAKNKSSKVVTNPSEKGFKPQAGWVKNVVKAEEQAYAEYNDLIGKTAKEYYNSQYQMFSTQEENKIPEFKSQLEKLNDVLKEIDDIAPINLLDSNADAQKNKLKELSAEADKLVDDLSDVQKYDFAKTVDIDVLSGRISDTLNKNSAMPKNIKDALESLREQLKQTNLSKQAVKNLEDQYKSLTSQMKASGKVGISFADKLGKKFKDVGAYFATYVSIYDFINAVKQGYQYVLEIDKQMIELEKVSDMTGQRLSESLEHANAVAKDLGSTISDVISATSDWSRLGYDADAAEELAEVAILYKNVGDGIDIDAANNSLISTLQGFQMEASEAMDIVDAFNEVANRMPIDSAGIGEALQRSAAAFNAANTDLNESIALITATNAVLQNPEKVGRMWTTVSARIRGAKQELVDAGEETDGMVESTSKLRDLVKGATGFDIMVDDNTYKNMKEIIVGIGKEWDKLSDIDQAGLLEALAGKQQSNALAAALSNYEMIEEAFAIAEGSAGSAMKEQEKWEQGLEARTNKLKSSLEELSMTFLDSDFLGGLIDTGRVVIEVITDIIDGLGVIPTLLAGIGAGFSIKSAITGNGRYGKTSPVSMNMPLAMNPIMDT